MATQLSGPELRHVYQNHHLDSKRWEAFTPRAGDIVVSTSYKAGTTLMQTIVMNLLFAESEPPNPILAASPWLDMRVRPLEPLLAELEAQTHRRCIKSHLPLDGLPYNENIKYVVVGRDARDVFMSLLNHYGNHTPMMFEMMNNLPGRVGDPFPKFDGDVHALWRNWTTRGWFEWESDGWPYWSHLHHAQTWWEFRQLPNIKLVHYADLRADLEGQMRAIAAFLEIEVPADAWPKVVNACRFETVKADPERVVDPMANMIWEGGGQTFIHKGTNGRWKDVLSAEELDLYHAAVKRKLTPDCAAWLERGSAAL